MATTTKTTLSSVDVKSAAPSTDPVSGITITAQDGEMAGVRISSEGALKTNANQNVLKLEFTSNDLEANSSVVARGNSNQADVSLGSGRDSAAYIGVTMNEPVTGSWSYELELTNGNDKKKWVMDKM